jgi:hypothetical protein
VPRPERFSLADVRHLDARGDLADLFQLLRLAALLQEALELVGDVEVVFNAFLPRPVTMMMFSTPDCMASSTPY